jgi:hypothetical protein
MLPSPNCRDNRGSNKSEEHLFQQKIRFDRRKIAPTIKRPDPPVGTGGAALLTSMPQR